LSDYAEQNFVVNRLEEFSDIALEHETSLVGFVYFIQKYFQSVYRAVRTLTFLAGKGIRDEACLENRRE
jgi:hypothetical protein